MMSWLKRKSFKNVQALQRVPLPTHGGMKARGGDRDKQQDLHETRCPPVPTGQSHRCGRDRDSARPHPATHGTCTEHSLKHRMRSKLSYTTATRAAGCSGLQRPRFLWSDEVAFIACQTFTILSSRGLNSM